MHEMSIALAVVEQVESADRPTGATTVNSVRLQVGELAGVVPDALAFSFELACRRHGAGGRGTGHRTRPGPRPLRSLRGHLAGGHAATAQLPRMRRGDGGAADRP